MQAKDRLALLEAIEEFEQVAGVGYVTFEQLPDRPMYFQCSSTKLFPKPVTKVEAMELLDRFGIDATFFSEHGDSGVNPEGMHEVNFND
ncbi:MAG: hypothetical protein AAGE93_15055 [Bacteroidota bacterium]